MTELDPLSEGARAAILDELRAPSGDPAMRARVAGKLEAALGAAFAATAVASASAAAPTAAAATTAPAAGASAAAKGAVTLTQGKLAAIVVTAVAAGAATGVGVERTWHPRHEPVALTSASQPTPQTVTSPVPTPPVAESASAAPTASVSASAAPTAPVSASAAATVADVAADLARERALIDAARAGLKHGNPAAALDAVQRHGKSFPQGQLREEREGIRILALAALGRIDEAKAYDKRFRVSFPESLLRPQIDAALAR